MARLSVVLIACLSVCFAFGQQKNPANSSYVDPTLGAVLKFRPLSWTFGYVMAGADIPIGKNRYVDINIGVPAVGVQRSNSAPGGFLWRAGLKLPMLHTSPYSIFYWMPEFSWGKYRVRDYSCYNCGMTYPPPTEITWAKQWAFSIDFGYRHVVPATFLFYEIGFGYGFGSISNSYYDLTYGQRPARARVNEDGKINGSMMSGHIAIGKAFRRKLKK